MEDYSRYKFNINGRICLRTMIPFGLLGLFIMYVSNPFFFSIIEKIPGNILNIICIVLMLIFLVDNIISFKIISNVNITSKKIKDNTEEITGEIAEEITEKVIQENLYTKDMPDPDLLIRTSGEMRLSNFLPWQLVYSEFLFVEKNWPDFSEEDLDEAIIEYQKRTRKFGAN